MTTGIRWLKIVLRTGAQAMIITSLLLGVQPPGTVKFFTHNLAAYAAVDPSRLLRDDIDQIAGMRAIDVDAINPDVGGVDIVGSPILMIDDCEIDPAFDRAIETCDESDEDPSVSFDGSDNGEDPDDDDIDWSQPMFVRGTNDETGREQRVYADDPLDLDRMHAAGIFGGSSGGFAPTTSGGMIDLMRHRDPIETVDFYVL